MFDEMYTLAVWLHTVAKEEEQRENLRRLVRLTWNAVVEEYGLDEEVSVFGYKNNEIPTIISTFASYLDDLDRELAEDFGSHGGYDLKKRLHVAGMSEAFVAERIGSGKRVFLKRGRSALSEDLQLTREISIYEKIADLKLAGFVKVLDVFRDSEYVTIVTAFADGGDLETFIKDRRSGSGLRPAEAKPIALQVAAALQQLHAVGIVHEDLKPRNILKFRRTWKLGDFGIAKNTKKPETGETFQGVGTYGYAAPEQWQGVEAHPSADIYSFGKTIVFLLTGQTDVDRVEYSLWRDLIQSCIRQHPDDRPSLQRIVDGLRRTPV